MKRAFLIAVSTILVLFTCSSCFSAASISSSSYGNDISKDDTYLDLTIMQTLSKGEALAKTSDYDIVKIETLEEVYYDGKKISGRFRLIDTYTYVTNSGSTKTVPVFVSQKEYKSYLEKRD